MNISSDIFRKLEERSRAFAAYLQEGLGLQKGDRVALMMPNLLQYPVALFGISCGGMIAWLTLTRFWQLWRELNIS